MLKLPFHLKLKKRKGIYNVLNWSIVQLYPLNVDKNNLTGKIVHIYFPEQINGTEYIPYTVLILGISSESRNTHDTV